MKMQTQDRIGWLEIGMGVFALSLAVGATLFVYGRSGDRLQSRRLAAEKPAAPGSIETERHKNIAAVAAR